MATVGDVMTRSILTIEPTTTVADAATIMGERRVGSALVMNGTALAGIFTERDIVRALGQHFDAAGHAVSEWMTADPKTVSTDLAVEEALDMMLEKGFRHLPVKEGDEVVGVVSMRDLSRAGFGRGGG